MNLMDGETIIESHKSSNTEIVLTTHRIRKISLNSENESINSLMLDQVTSCKFTKEKDSFLLLIAIAAFLLSIIEMQEHSLIAFALIIFGGVLFWRYFNQNEGLKIATPSSTIWIATKGKDDKFAEDFIDKIEAARFAIEKSKGIF